MAKSRINIKEVFSAEEIAILDLLLIIWERKKLLLIPILIGLVLAVIAIYTAPDEYVSSSIKISEVSSSKSSSNKTKGLTRLLGVGGAEDDNLNLSSPSLYPSYINSQEFLLDLMQESFYFRDQKDSLTLFEFFVTYDEKDLVATSIETILSLPTSIKESLSSNSENKTSEFRPPQLLRDSRSVKKITNSHLKVMKALQSRMEIITNDGKFVTLTIRMPDPIVSAMCNEFAFNKLTDFVIDQKTAKARRDLFLLEQKTQLAREKFEAIELELANVIDANRGVISSAAQVKRKRLESQYNIHFNIYNSLAVQIEQSRLELEETTPLFIDFEPAYVPLKPEESSSSGLFLYGAAGLFLGLILMVIKILRELRG